MVRNGRTGVVRGKQVSRKMPRENEFQRTVRELCGDSIEYLFSDFHGSLHHYEPEISDVAPDKGRVGYDASSIPGFAGIDESDMFLVPDLSTAFKVPLFPGQVGFICDSEDPDTGQPYESDTRQVAKRAEQFLIDSGVATQVFVGPEVEFYIFDDARFQAGPNFSYHRIESAEGEWTDNPMRMGRKGAYFPAHPRDSLKALRREMVENLKHAGIQIEVQHHEVGSAGQAEIGMRRDTLTRMGDRVLVYKMVVRGTADKAGKVVTFMPKPIFGDNGTGMHVHMSLWNNGRNLFYDRNEYAMLSETARHFIGGVLAHAPSLLALTAPTTNSYKRLVPGYEAPIALLYSRRNRSAAIRIPVVHSPGAVRAEIRFPDPMCNPYFAFSAILMAGLDGIENKTEPPKPVDKDIYHGDLTPEERARVVYTPGSLREVREALQRGHEYLLKGGVFTRPLLEKWDAYLGAQIEAVELRPSPAEFNEYFAK